MPGAIIVCVVWLGAVIFLGGLAAWRAPRAHPPVRTRRVASRLSSSVATATSELGHPFTATVVVLAGWAVTLIVCWPLGELAQRMQNAIDLPAFHWVQAHQVSGGWSNAWRQITDIGSPRNTQIATILGAIVFALIWHLRERRWYVPLITLPVAYLLVKYGQTILKDVVDRGHPTTSLGTWPSGGCARVIVIYGLIIVFALLAYGPKGRRPWIAGVTTIAFLVSVQGYARTYNLEHWLTDVIGGIIFGIFMIAVMLAAFYVLDRPRWHQPTTFPTVMDPAATAGPPDRARGR